MTYCRMIGEWDCENDSPHACFITLCVWRKNTRLSMLIADNQCSVVIIPSSVIFGRLSAMSSAVSFCITLITRFSGSI